MSKIQDIFRFTKYERKVLLFLFITSVTAMSLNFIKNQNESDAKKFEYAELDSIFINSGKSIESQNNEKNVDSEHELLDLRVSDNKYKKIESKLLAVKSININTAKKNTLKKLPGIGSKTADAIIDYRNLEGKFQQVSDLKKIKGIGQKKFEKIKKYIIIK